MDGLSGKTLLIKMDDLGVPLFSETSRCCWLLPQKNILIKNQVGDENSSRVSSSRSQLESLPWVQKTLMLQKNPVDRLDDLVQFSSPAFTRGGQQKGFWSLQITKRKMEAEPQKNGVNTRPSKGVKFQPPGLLLVVKGAQISDPWRIQVG